MSELGRRLKMLFGRRRWRRELEEEMALHRELRARQLGAADAARRFGDELRLRERSAQQWGWSWLESFAQDVHHGLRLLARTPAASALALLSLGLGIGANTALFSLTDAVLLRSLPVAHPEQLVLLESGGPQARRPSPVFTNPMWEAIRDRQRAFAGMMAWSFTNFNLNAGGEQRLVAAAYASGSYFATLGVAAERGRVFGPSDDFRGCPAVAVVSDAFWRSHFNAAPGAVGSTLALNGHPFEVIGVSAPGFFGLQPGFRSEVTVPICTEALLAPESLLNDRAGWWLNLMGRLPPGETAAAAEARMQAQMPAVLAATLPSDYNARAKANYLARRIRLAPGANGLSGLRNQYGMPLRVLLAVAGVVLLIACANLAGLMLARGAARRREIAVRLALGASRARIVRQMLTESLLLAVGGAALGVALAAWACGAIEHFWSSAVLDTYLNLAPDVRMLAFTVGLTFAAALLVGLAPALAATRAPQAAGARGEAAAPQRGMRAMVALQLALSLVLLAGAGLFLRSFVRLTSVPTGFEASQVMLVRLAASSPPPPDAVVLRQRARILEALRALPGAASGSESFIIPTSGLQWDNSLATAGSGASIPDAYFNAITPGYFATLGTPLLAGRDFRASDDAAAPPVTILSQSAARVLFPRGGALGSMVHQPAGSLLGRPAQVVGIVADAKYTSLREADPPAGYYPLAQLPRQFPTTSFELRSDLPSTALGAGIRAALARAAPGAGYQLSTLPQQMAAAIKPERLLAWLSGLFGGLALLLTAIGLYGMAAYGASRRRREFGVRIALGAPPAHVTRLALRALAATLLWGAGLGLLAAWCSARALQATLGTLLFGLRPTDLATLAAAAGLLVLVALCAAWLPARRAARADPLAALRED